MGSRGGMIRSMLLRPAVVVVVLVVGVLIGGCANDRSASSDPSSNGIISPDSGGAAAHRSGSLHVAVERSTRCGSHAVSLSLASPISPQTGEHGRIFELRNTSSSACFVRGTPTATLYDHERRLPFVYRYPAGRRASLYVSGEPPQPVYLAPDSVAYFFIAKYRCDLGVSSDASELRIALSGGGGSHVIQLPRDAGVSALDYCRSYLGDHTPDPGNRVDVSAIVASPWASR
jgi:hypothetical protein